MLYSVRLPLSHNDSAAHDTVMAHHLKKKHPNHLLLLPITYTSFGHDSTRPYPTGWSENPRSSAASRAIDHWQKTWNQTSCYWCPTIRYTMNPSIPVQVNQKYFRQFPNRNFLDRVSFSVAIRTMPFAVSRHVFGCQIPQHAILEFVVLRSIHGVYNWQDLPQVGTFDPKVSGETNTWRRRKSSILGDIHDIWRLTNTAPAITKKW